MYYKGVFKAGAAKYRNDKYFFKSHLTRKDIEEIIKDMIFRVS